MKTFQQLTYSQQRLAIKKFFDQLKSLMKEGVLISTERLSRHELRRMATLAAEGAYYAQDGDEIVHGVVS